MEWIEAKIITTSEGIEPITGLLMVHNLPNIRIIDDAEVSRFLLDHPMNWDYKEEPQEDSNIAEIIFYVHNDEVGQNLLFKIENELNNIRDKVPEISFGNIELLKGPVNDDDWLHEWKKTYKSFIIGKNIVIRPFWEELADTEEKIVFTIDPGAVFGTGQHETTQLCIIAMEDMDMNKKNVLDIGCGSGILSLIALLLGAEHAVACDIDPGAARCAARNAELNNINLSKYEIYTGEISDLLHNKYDIIIANIVADVIIDISPEVKNILSQEGYFIVSGIISERVCDVRDALLKYGFNIKKEYHDNNWHSLVVCHA